MAPSPIHWSTESPSFDFLTLNKERELHYIYHDTHNFSLIIYISLSIILTCGAILLTISDISMTLTSPCPVNGHKCIQCTKVTFTVKKCYDRQ